MPDPQYPNQADKHRFVFKALTIENADKAKPGEFIVDKEKGIIYVKGEDGKLHSQSVDTMTKLKELEDSGILQSAMAYVNNAEIYTIYKNKDKIKLDDALKLSTNARYYSLRGTDPNTGKMMYLTGTLNNGNVENSLVDVVHDISDPKVAYTGTAATGKLHTPSIVQEGKPYYLELYNSERILITSVPAQVVEVKSLNFALAPEFNCIKLQITTSQDTNNGGKEESYIYQGQPLSALEIWVTGIYGNGDKKLLNNDLASSRLIITTEPKDIDTNVIGTEFKIKARYYVQDVDMNSATPENLLKWESIEAEKTVRVIEDVYTKASCLIPVPFVKKEKLPNQAAMSDQIDLRIFALYEDGKLEDVTKNTRLTVSSEFNKSEFDTIQKFKLALGLGASATQFEENVTLLMGSSPHHQIRRLTLEHANWNMSESNPLLKTPVVQVDTKNDKFKNWMRINADDPASQTDTYTTNATQKGSVSAVIELGKRTINGETVTPTHIRIRSVIKPEFLHTPSPIDIGSVCEGFEFTDTSTQWKLDSYKSTNHDIPYPVLIEFLKFDDQKKTYERLAVVPAFTTSTTDFV